MIAPFLCKTKAINIAMLEDFGAQFQDILRQPVASLTVILNLILIESLLSVDNAAVLATMVMELPKDQRQKALRYGIFGAYVFRGICLFFAALLIQIWWFKPVGGIYLLVLALKYFFSKKKEEPQDVHVISEEIEQAHRSWLWRKTLGAFGPFWATVILVELMDLAFSIDNVIAANAYTRNLLLIWTGVFIGILAMRFVAQGFVKLLERYPFLHTCAYLVILILGVKLTLAGYTHFVPCGDFSLWLEGPMGCMESRGEHMPEGEHPMVWGDVITSVVSIGIFIIPVLTSYLFNFPKRHRA